jgi:hypothetical protein
MMMMMMMMLCTMMAMMIVMTKEMAVCIQAGRVGDDIWGGKSGCADVASACGTTRYIALNIKGIRRRKADNAIVLEVGRCALGRVMTNPKACVSFLCASDG